MSEGCHPVWLEMLLYHTDEERRHQRDMAPAVFDAELHVLSLYPPQRHLLPFHDADPASFPLDTPSATQDLNSGGGIVDKLLSSIGMTKVSQLHGRECSKSHPSEDSQVFWVDMNSQSILVSIRKSRSNREDQLRTIYYNLRV